MRFAFDSNILVYAVDTATPDKHEVAQHIIERAFVADAVLVTQTVGEFLSVFTRKFPDKLSQARLAAELWAELFPLVGSTGEHVIAASRFAEKHRLQYWDALIMVAARSAGANYLISEDMQDGLSVDGLTLVDPFNPGNAALIDALLTPIAGDSRP